MFPLTLKENELQEKAKQMRKDIVEMVHAAASGHPGGSLSSVEILVTLYNVIMKHDPANPKWEDRDYFILCKGHIAPAYYSILSRVGYFDPKELLTLRKLGSRLQGHPAPGVIPGIEMSAGSLGQNASIATGLALGLKLKNQSNRVYALSSEGEIQEGQTWEATMAAAHYHLDNLCLTIDYNNLQIDGWVEDVMGVAPLAEKYKAFNWHVIEVDGHSFPELIAAYKKAKTLKDRPTVVIAKTIKGKGVSFMENEAIWHGKAPSTEEKEKALQELSS